MNRRELLQTAGAALAAVAAPLGAAEATMAKPAPLKRTESAMLEQRNMASRGKWSECYEFYKGDRYRSAPE